MREGGASELRGVGRVEYGYASSTRETRYVWMYAGQMREKKRELSKV